MNGKLEKTGVLYRGTKIAVNSFLRFFFGKKNILPLFLCPNTSAMTIKSYETKSHYFSANCVNKINKFSKIINDIFRYNSYYFFFLYILNTKKINMTFCEFPTREFPTVLFSKILYYFQLFLKSS